MTPQTITNCFRHAGFSIDKAAPTSKDDEDFDVEDDIPHSRLREHGLTLDVLTEFTRVDDEIQTCAELTNDDIVEELSSTETHQLHQQIKHPTRRLIRRPPYK